MPHCRDEPRHHRQPRVQKNLSQAGVWIFLSALNIRKDGQTLRWGQHVVWGSAQGLGCKGPDSRLLTESRLWVSSSWGNGETEGCGGGQETQNSLVFDSILTVDQDCGCLDQLGTNADLEIQEARRLCHQLSLSMYLCHALGKLRT